MAQAIEESLVSFFTSTTYVAKDIADKIGKRCHVGMVPKNQSNLFPRLFLGRAEKIMDLDLDGGGKGSLIEDTFDLEVISNKSSDILAITRELWYDVHGHFGSITGTVSVKGILLENQDDDYEPKGVGDDSGLDIAALSMRVMYAST